MYSNGDGGMSAIRNVVEDTTWAGPGQQLVRSTWV